MKLTLQRMVRAVNRNSREQSTSKKAKEAEDVRKKQNCQDLLFRTSLTFSIILFS